MNVDVLLEQMPDLMSAAVAKCRNYADAEDLVQETMVAGLEAIAAGKPIINLRLYLFRILKNKYYDLLRRKYRCADIVCMDSICELAEIEESPVELLIAAEDAETIRREVAYLSRIYRETVIAYYFRRQGIAEIAASLGISEGTVKSRLSTGRQQIKKGVELMEKYSEKSFSPVNLWVSCTGQQGLHGEPFTLCSNAMDDNILICAYEQPTTVFALAKTLGIPAAYVEPEVEKLIAGGLMQRMGDGKVYTDFIIWTLESRRKYVQAQVKFAESYTDAFWNEIAPVLDALCAELCPDTDEGVRDKFRMYAVLKILQSVTWESCTKLCPNVPYTEYPDRPNGGKWYAMGISGVMSCDSDKESLRSYSVDGTNNITVHNCYGKKSVTVSQFGHALGQTWRSYCHVVQYQNDDAYARLLYAVAKEIDPIESQLDPALYENLTVLEKAGIVKSTETGVKIDIPVLTSGQMSRFWKITGSAVDNIITKYGDDLVAFIASKKYETPVHIKNILPMHRYMNAFDSIPMAVVYRAIDTNLFSFDITVPHPAMLIIENA